jgi:hypothetical protein
VYRILVLLDLGKGGTTLLEYGMEWTGFAWIRTET